MGADGGGCLCGQRWGDARDLQCVDAGHELRGRARPGPAGGLGDAPATCSPEGRCGTGLFPPSAGGWMTEIGEALVSCGLPPWRGDGGLPSPCLCVLMSSYEGAGHRGLGLTPDDLVNLHYTFKSAVNKHSHILRCCR